MIADLKADSNYYVITSGSVVHTRMNEEAVHATQAGQTAQRAAAQSEQSKRQVPPLGYYHASDGKYYPWGDLQHP
jgi:hypothetical protein